MVFAIGVALPVLLPTQTNIHNYVANLTEACRKVDILCKPAPDQQVDSVR